jgi:hypothetical protein
VLYHVLHAVPEEVLVIKVMAKLLLGITMLWSDSTDLFFIRLLAVVCFPHAFSDLHVGEDCCE